MLTVVSPVYSCGWPSFCLGPPLSGVSVSFLYKQRIDLLLGETGSLLSDCHRLLLRPHVIIAHRSCLDRDLDRRSSAFLFCITKRGPDTPARQLTMLFANRIDRFHNIDPSIAAANNSKLLALGRKQNWQALLSFAKQEQEQFDNVNYATLMSQLGRIPSLNKTDPRFLEILETLAQEIKERGLPWIRAREAANIVHALGKMKLTNSSTRLILEWISKPDTAACFMKEAMPQEVANVAWAFARLSFDGPALFAEIDRRPTWLLEHGKPQEVANIAWACATLSFGCPNLFAEIDCQSKWLVKAANPQHVANVAWAFATLSFDAPALFAEIERQSKWLVENGKPQVAANTAWACATLGFTAPSLFAEIDRQAKWLVQEGTQQDVANTAWACATLGFTAPTLFAEIELRSKWLVQEGKPQEVANTAWACAKLGFTAPTLFAEIERQSKWLVENGKPQVAANTAWACATLGFTAPSLFAEIDRQAKWLVQEGTQQDVANTAWACATLGFTAPTLFAEIECGSKWLVQEGMPQEIANTAWAFAIRGFDCPKLFAEIDRQASWLVQRGTRQAVANTAWACATLGFTAPSLFAEIEHQAKWLVAEGTQQDVANTAWACATVGFTAPTLFAEIESRSKWLVQEGTEQEVANTAWACAALGFDCPHLFVEIEHHAKWLVQEGTLQAVSNTAWACATLGYEAVALFSEIDQHVEKFLNEGRPCDIANIAWAFTTRGILGYETSLTKLWNKAIELFIGGQEFANEEHVQLLQTMMFVTACGVNLPRPPEMMSAKIELVLQRQGANTSSNSVKHLSKSLREIGFHHQLEVPLDGTASGGMWAIDLACCERMIAIEFDGPSHYLKAPGSGKLTSIENGATKAKRRFLELLGYTVVNIDYRDYALVKGSPEEKQWLCEKLGMKGETRVRPPKAEFSLDPRASVFVPATSNATNQLTATRMDPDLETTSTAESRTPGSPFNVSASVFVPATAGTTQKATNDASL